MVEALHRHTRLLKEYRRRAFDDLNRDYWGEVAAKLRLLLLPGPDDGLKMQNKPLLRLLQESSGLSRQLDVDVFGGTTLDDFLSERGLAISTGEEERFARISNAELINAWATQHGAAHEDWAFTAAFAGLHPRGDGETDGLAVAASQLSLIAEATIQACETLLERIGGKGISDGAPR
jgi:hypothetical protein